MALAAATSACAKDWPPTSTPTRSGSRTASVSEPNREAARARYEAGLEHLGQGALEPARREFREALALWPDDARARVWAGVVARRLGRAAEADALIKRGLGELERHTGKRARAASAPGPWSSTLSWSADLTRIAAQAFEEVVVLDRQTSSPHLAVPGIAAALSPDGRRLVTKAADLMLYVWDVESGRSVGQYPSGLPPGQTNPFAHPSEYDWNPGLVWSDDGAHIASLERDFAAVISVADGRLQKLPGEAAGLEFSRGSGCLASGERVWETDGFSRIWPAGDRVDATTAPTDLADVFAIASNCSLAARALSETAAVVVSAPRSRQPKHSLSLGHPATALSFDSDAKRVAIAAERVLLWDLDNSSPKAVGPRPARGKSVQFGRDGSLWYMDAFGAVQCAGKTTRRPALSASISVVDVSDQGRAMFFGTTSGELIEWQPEAARVRRLAALGERVTALDTHGSRWVVGLEDGSLRTGSLAEPGSRRTLGKHTASVDFVAFGASGTQVISQAGSRRGHATPEAELVVRNATTGAEIRRWTTAGLTLPAVSADGKRLAYLSVADGEGKRWQIVDLGSGRTEHTLGFATFSFGSSALSRTGDIVATRLPGASSGFLIWSPDPAAQPRHLRGLPAIHGPTGMSTSLDGRFIALAEEWDRITLWDSLEMRLVGALDGAPAGATNLAFSSDGSLVYATAKGHVWVWRTRERQLIAELSVTQNGDALCAVSPDGRVQVVGSGVPACAVCRIGPFVLPVEACAHDPQLISAAIRPAAQP